MKKIMLIIVSLFFAFALAGCDFFTENEIIEFSEQYCRDNPSSDICQGEDVGTIENATIENIYNKILELSNTEDWTSMCEDYIAISNIAFYDSCLDKSVDFFPQDYTDFSITTIGTPVVEDNQTLYTLETLNTAGTKKVLFSIAVTSLDNMIYVSQWSYEEEDIVPIDEDTVTQEQAREYYQGFIDSYNDINIPHQEVCSNYDFGVELEECVNARIENHSNNITITLSSFTYNEETDDYTIVLTFHFDTEDVSVTQTLAFLRGEDGEIEIDLIMADYFEDLFLNVDSFFQRFFNDVATATEDNNICEIYATDENDPFCTMLVEDSLYNGYSFTYNYLEGKDLEYTVYITVHDGDDAFPFSFNVVMSVDDNNNLTFKMYDTNLNNNENIDSVYFFFDLFNQGSSFDEICSYLMNGTAECDELFSEYYSDSFRVDVIDYEVINDNTFLVTVGYVFNQDVYPFVYEVMVLQSGDSFELYIELRSQQDTYNDVYNYLEDLITDINNDTDVNTLADKYMISSYIDGLLELLYILDDPQLYIYNFQLYEEDGEFVVDFNISDEFTLTYILYVEFQDEQVLGIFDSYSRSLYDETSIKNKFSDMFRFVVINYDTYDTCLENFSDEDVETCVSMLFDYTYSNYQVSQIIVIIQIDSFAVTIEANRPDGTLVTYELTLRSGTLDSTRLEVLSSNILTVWEQEDLLNTFLELYNNKTVSNDALGSLLFNTDTSEFAQRRDTMLANDYTIEIAETNLLFYPITITLEVRNSNHETVHLLTYDVDFLKTNNDQYISLLNPREIELLNNPEDAVEMINLFLDDLSNPEISIENFCAQYSNEYNDCEFLKQLALEHELTFEGTLSGYTDYSDLFHVSVDVISESTLVVDTVEWNFSVYLLDQVPQIRFFHTDYIDIDSNIYLAGDFINQYITDYFDSTITDENFMLKYNLLYNGFVRNRQNDLIDYISYEISFIDTIYLDYNDYYQADVLIHYTNADIEKTVSLLYHDLHDGTYLVELPYPDISLTSVEVEPFLITLEQDFIDSTLSSEQICERYSYEVHENCINLRELYIANDYSVVFEVVQYDSDSTMISIQFFDIQNTLVFEEKYNARPFLDSLGTMDILFNFYFTVEPEIPNYDDYMEQLVDDLDSGNYTVEEFCQEHDCFSALLEKPISSAYYIGKIDFSVTPLDNKLTIGIIFDYTDGDSYLSSFYITMDADNNFHLYENAYYHFNPEELIEYDQENAQLLLDTFVLNLVDPSISHEELSEMYLFGSMLTRDAFPGRDRMLTEGATISVTIVDKVTYEPYEYYIVEVIETYPTETITYTMRVGAFYAPVEEVDVMFFMDIYK